MTMTYPLPVSGDEFKGKRVLVTGHKGHGTSDGAPFYSERCFCSNDCALTAAGWAGRLLSSYRRIFGTAAGVQGCNQFAFSRNGLDSTS